MDQLLERSLEEPIAGSLHATRKRLALIPAHNEARFIGSVVLQTLKYVDHVVVIDDGSTDATAAIACAAGAEVLSMHENAGKARALARGFRHVRHLQPTSVVMIDGDGQHDPSQIPFVLEPIEAGEADIVIGSRFIGIESDIPGWRVFGQHGLTLATNLASGVFSTDSQSGFRAFSPAALPFLEFDAEGFSVESEMQFIARQNALRLAEVPISVIYEEPPKRNPIPHAMQVLHGTMHLAGQHRPLLIFGLLGTLIMMMGFLMGLWVVDIFRQSQQLAVGYALLSVLLSILGSISMATGVILHSVRGLLLSLSRRSTSGNAALEARYG